MVDLTTIILTLNNIRSKVRSVLHKSPNSDLAVCLVKLNAVLSELTSLHQELRSELPDTENSDDLQSKFKVGDIVLYDGCIGRIQKVEEPDDEETKLITPYIYLLGKDYNGGEVWRCEYELTGADYRDEIRILNGGKYATLST